MDFNIDSYEPIDYRNWVLGDSCRRAANLKRLNLLKLDEIALVDLSSKYQDCRNDPGHGEHAVYSSLKLLPYHTGAKREVVVSAAWMHDMGFYGVDPNAWKRLVDELSAAGNIASLSQDEAQRRPHQNRGCLLAGRLLERLANETAPHRERIESYDGEIADIIGDHDTKKLPTTVNGKIVRTADLLWRTSYPHTQVYMADWSPDRVPTRVEETCLEGKERIHLGEIGIAIARLELANTMVFKFGKDVASKVLSPKYQKELERIIAIYQ